MGTRRNSRAPPVQLEDVRHLVELGLRHLEGVEAFALGAAF
jgi:hypothetical protein